MILNNFFIGFIEDNAGLFIIPKLISGLKGCTDFIGFPTGLCHDLLVSNQPFTFITAFLLAQALNPVLAYNLIILLGSLLNFLFAYKFFGKLFKRLIAFLLALILFCSPYLAYQSRSHLDLLQFWPVIWFLHILFFSTSKYKAIILGFLLTLITGISNYLSYFTFLFLALYLPLLFLVSSEKVTLIKQNILKGMLGMLVFATTSAVFMAPYVKSNFFAPRVRTEINTDGKAVNRPFEDFITFSSRPWYYLLPSVDNPFFGKASQNVLNQLSSNGNYLTQNYFKSEHSASYLGLVNLILAVINYFGLRSRMFCQLKSRVSATLGSGPGLRRPSPRVAEHSPQVGQNNNALSLSALFLTIITLIILTMPPAFTLNESTFYTPSYFLYKFFPMFRVTARLGILILFLSLIYTGYGYAYLQTALVNKKVKIQLVRIFLVLLALVSILEFIIPLKLTRVETPPKVYVYISQGTRPKSPIVVYPYNKTNEALFWMTVHKQPLVNPRYYEDMKTKFYSEDFSKNLNTPDGLKKAKAMGAEYLVYFYNNDGVENINFFNTHPGLTKIETFEESGPPEQNLNITSTVSTPLIRIIEVGTSTSNSAILYQFLD